MLCYQIFVAICLGMQHFKRIGSFRCDLRIQRCCSLMLVFMQYLDKICNRLATVHRHMLQLCGGKEIKLPVRYFYSTNHVMELRCSQSNRTATKLGWISPPSIIVDNWI